MDCELRYAKDRHRVVVARHGAERWTAMRVEACRATRVEARQSEVLLDRRIMCLDRWLDELADTVAIAERARDRAEVDHAVRASKELSPLAACADVRALSDVQPLPTGASERAAAIEVARRINEIDVERRAGRIAGLPSKIHEVVAAARKRLMIPRWLQRWWPRHGSTAW